MTFLEFIRKHLIIAIIAIVGILVGLIMMDYGDSGSTFSRDYLIEINGTRYKQNDVAQQAMDTKSHLTRLSALSGYEKMLKELITKSDFNKNGRIDDAKEQLKYDHLYLEAIASHPYFKLQKIQYLWEQIGPFQTEGTRELNIGTARYLVREVAKRKGIIPSDQQITDYIQTMNAFRNAANEFSMERYKDYVGTTANGEVNASNERNFRELISDFIIWDTICTYYTGGLNVNAKAEGKIQSFNKQVIDGWIASYNINDAPEAEEPKEEEIQAYHANNRDKYLTGELRTYAIIKIDAKDGMSDDALGYAAEEIQEALAKAPAATTKSVIHEAIRTSENDIPRDLKYTISEPATCDSSAITEELKQTVMDNNQEVELSTAVFNEKLKASGAARYSSYYRSPDGKSAYIVRIDNIQTAVPLEYAQAREAALADLKAANKAELFNKTVDELYTQISADLAAGKDIQAAFNAAKERCDKLNVEPITAIDIKNLALMNMGDVPTNRADLAYKHRAAVSALRSTPNGALAPLNKSATYATIIGITEHKTMEGSDEIDKDQLNAELHMQIMQAWLSSAYERYETKLPSED